ncbi:UNKNOWN [Stylonychia lemnae]|uniref:Transmembrane protein n=1 Tax=Stylonychia lemnae TaxID=5949 RepID=A0A078AN23_STYLE|nr:UNKNOWN [Stylonychia lemnae]|eukprot:CDW83331.1 UNKNOWN [Stylonychia lemnae]
MRIVLFMILLQATIGSRLFLSNPSIGMNQMYQKLSQSQSSEINQDSQNMTAIQVQQEPQPYSKYNHPLVDYILGSIFLFFAVTIIWLNERRSVCQVTPIYKAWQQCEAVQDFKHPQENQNMKLVHVEGETRIQEGSKVIDPEFDVEVDYSIKLIREVEMYQWIEKKKIVSGETLYFYDKEWTKNHIDSTQFKEPNDKFFQNPETLPYESQIFYNEQVYFGGFVLSRFELDKIQNKCEIKYNKELVDRVQAATGDKLKVLGSDYFILDGCNLLSKKQTDQRNYAEIGDIRVSFFNVPCGPATVIAQQVQHKNPKDEKYFTFQPWDSLNQDKILKESDDQDSNSLVKQQTLAQRADISSQSSNLFYNALLNYQLPEQIHEVVDQPCHKDQVFQDLVNKSIGSLWPQRIFGYFASIIAYCILITPLLSSLNFLGLLKELDGRSNYLKICVLSILISLATEVFIIGLAWIRYKYVFSTVMFSLCAKIILFILLI